MKNRKNRVLVLESMESRLVLSQATIAPVGNLVSALVQVKTRAIHLAGTFRGGYQTDAVENVPDAGKKTTLLGVGRLGGGARSLIAGDLNALGFVQKGKATGTLTLMTARGVLTLALTGPDQTGFSPLPGTFNYQITKGTGVYKNTTDRGTLSLTLNSASTNPSCTSMPFNRGFTLTFHSGAAPV